MTTYTKETALYDTGAIAGDIQEAGETASKFLSVDDTGIMVYDGSDGIQPPSNPGTNTNNVFIDDNSLDIRKGTTVLASFGETTNIGDKEKSYILLTDTSISGYSNDIPYFNFNLEGAVISVWTGELLAENVWTGSTSFPEEDDEHLSFDFPEWVTPSLNSQISYYMGYWTDTPPRGITFGLSFTYGVAETKSHKDANNRTWYVSYDGDKQFYDIYATHYISGSRLDIFMGWYKETPSPTYNLGNDNTLTGAFSIAEGAQNTAGGNYSHAEGLKTVASGMASHSQNEHTLAKKRAQTVIGTYNLEDVAENTTHSSRILAYGKYSFIIGNGIGENSGRSNALTVDWGGNVEAAGGVIINKTDTAQKDLTYVNEYVRLAANQTASESAGQLKLSTSNKSCLIANKYDAIWSDYMNECVSVTDGVVTILKSGRYRFDYQVYFYNGFTANDIPTCGIGLDGLNGALLRASRFKTTVTNPYTTLSGSYIGWGEKGHTFHLMAQNSTDARGVVGLSEYTRLTITCLMTH